MSKTPEGRRGFSSAIKKPMWIAIVVVMAANAFANAFAVFSMPLERLSSDAFSAMRLALVPCFLVLAVLAGLRARAAGRIPNE